LTVELRSSVWYTYGKLPRSTVSQWATDRAQFVSTARAARSHVWPESAGLPRKIREPTKSLAAHSEVPPLVSQKHDKRNGTVYSRTSIGCHDAWCLWQTTKGFASLSLLTTSRNQSGASQLNFLSWQVSKFTFYGTNYSMINKNLNGRDHTTMSGHWAVSTFGNWETRRLRSVDVVILLSDLVA